MLKNHEARYIGFSETDVQRLVIDGTNYYVSEKRIGTSLEFQKLDWLSKPKEISDNLSGEVSHIWKFS